MVDFNRKRLQVFISSTYTDLIDERQAAVEAILSHGHIPAGMELFTSGDESQIDVIKQWIEDSDVYLLILGGRYGSIKPNSEKSYTQLEYEYAIELGKPYFACVVKEQAQENRVRIHGTSFMEKDNPQKLKEFRQLVESKVVEYWGECKDIQLVVGKKLSSLARREDLVGWVRADQMTVEPAIAEEMARIRKENEQLRSQLAKASPVEALINGLNYQELSELLESRNLLGFFEAFDPLSPVFRPSKDGALELFGIGLVEKIEKSTNWRLSEPGKIFYNRFCINKAKS